MLLHPVLDTLMTATFHASIPLFCKPGQNKTDYRWELNLKFDFGEKPRGQYCQTQEGSKRESDVAQQGGELTLSRMVLSSSNLDCWKPGRFLLREEKDNKAGQICGEESGEGKKMAGQKAEAVKFGCEKEVEVGRRLKSHEETRGV